jgi:hypothetical protein
MIDRDPVIPFRVSHEVKLNVTADGVKSLQRWAIAAFGAMTTIGGGILVTLLVRG